MSRTEEVITPTGSIPQLRMPEQHRLPGLPMSVTGHRRTEGSMEQDQAPPLVGLTGATVHSLMEGTTDTLQVITGRDCSLVRRVPFASPSLTGMIRTWQDCRRARLVPLHCLSSPMSSSLPARMMDGKWVTSPDSHVEKGFSLCPLAGLHSWSDDSGNTEWELNCVGDRWVKRMCVCVWLHRLP